MYQTHISWTRTHISLHLSSSWNIWFSLPLQLLHSSILELQCFILSLVCMCVCVCVCVCSEYQMQPMWNIRSETLTWWRGNAFAPNSSIYWIVVNIPGSGDSNQTQTGSHICTQSSWEKPPSVPPLFHLLTKSGTGKHNVYLK